MNVRSFARAILLLLALGGGAAQAGSQPSVGIVKYNPQDKINEARSALRLAKSTLSDTQSKAKSLVSKAERTADLKEKVKLLQQAADLLTKANTLRQQVAKLEATLEQLGIAKEAYETQQALARQQAELAAQKLLEQQQANLTQMAASTAAIPATNQPAPNLITIDADTFFTMNEVVGEVAGSFNSDLLKKLAKNGLDMTFAHSDDFGWIVFDKDVAAFKTELLKMQMSSPDSFSKAVEKVGLDVVTDVVATRITRAILEETFGDDVDIDLIMSIAPQIAGLIRTGVEAQVAIEAGKATAATVTTPGSVIVTGVQTSIKVFQATRAAALLSYGEDDNFASVAASIETIGQLSALASSSTASAAQRQQMTALRNSTITSAAEAINVIFGGSDGPVIEGMFRTAIKARELLDKGDTKAAQTLVNEMKANSQYANPLDITNNFYENVFMIFRKPDAERAYDILIDYAGLSELNV